MVVKSVCLPFLHTAAPLSFWLMSFAVLSHSHISHRRHFVPYPLLVRFPFLANYIPYIFFLSFKSIFSVISCCCFCFGCRELYFRCVKFHPNFTLWMCCIRCCWFQPLSLPLFAAIFFCNPIFWPLQQKSVTCHSLTETHSPFFCGSNSTQIAWFDCFTGCFTVTICLLSADTWYITLCLHRAFTRQELPLLQELLHILTFDLLGPIESQTAIAPFTRSL